MLQTKSLSFSYDAQNSFSFPDIQLGVGEHLLILGKSGIGKTTLLHLLAGLLKSNSGEVLVKETNISQLPIGQLDKFRGENIGLVFQKPHFVGALTLLENLLLIQKIGRGKSDKNACIKSLEAVDLAHKAKQKPYLLSQGEQQRAGIAIATINQPAVILADEPTASLDDENCQKVMSLLLSQAEIAQSNLIVITHDSRVKPHFGNVLELTK